jgi:hypothetical protein
MSVLRYLMLLKDHPGEAHDHCKIGARYTYGGLYYKLLTL